MLLKIGMLHFYRLSKHCPDGRQAARSGPAHSQSAVHEAAW